MKLLSYRLGGEPMYGAVVGGGVVNAHARLGEEFSTLRGLLNFGSRSILNRLARQTPDHGFDEISFDLPLPDASKILCAGRNYPAYHEVQADGGPKFPSIFARLAHSFAPHGTALQVPSACPNLDYECELVAVIGRGGKNIRQKDALSHVMGYTIMNEGSVRKWEKSGTQNFPTKNFDHCGSLGPWIVTADEIPDPSALYITTRRNGEVVQEGATDLMIFDIPYLISHISEFLSLEPGDMIATGSPGGSIMGTENPNWLKPGDQMFFAVSGIGELENSVSKSAFAK